MKCTDDKGMFIARSWLSVGYCVACEQDVFVNVVNVLGYIADRLGRSENFC